MSDSSRARVLIVDDDQGILQISRMGLKRVKYRGQKLEIFLAASGAEALSSLAEHPGVGVVLIDGEMETHTAGLDTCRAIREDFKNADVRIFLRTGNVDMNIREEEATRVWDLQGHMPKGDTSKDQMVEAVLAALDAYYARIEGNGC